MYCVYIYCKHTYIINILFYIGSTYKHVLQTWQEKVQQIICERKICKRVIVCMCVCVCVCAHMCVCVCMHMHLIYTYPYVELCMLEAQVHCVCTTHCVCESVYAHSVCMCVLDVHIHVMYS